MKKLKRVVIKEELIALTNDFLEALILNQMLYWSQRVKDFDQFILEEKNRRPDEVVNISDSKGWIYKKAVDLHDELMLGKSFSRPTVSRRIDSLVKKGFIDKKKEKNWDKTSQYRVNVRYIQQMLEKIGFSLEGYPLSWKTIEPEIPDVHGEHSNVHDEHPNAHCEHPSIHDEHPNVHSEHVLYTEITTETTKENTYQNTVADFSDDISKEVIDYLNQQLSIRTEYSSTTWRHE